MDQAERAVMQAGNAAMNSRGFHDVISSTTSSTSRRDALVRAGFLRVAPIFNVTLTIYIDFRGYALRMPRRTDPATVIRSQVVLEEHDVAPDGRFAVVVRRFVHGDRYRSHLWLVPLGGKGQPIQLTSGAVRDSSPRVSPDGTAVAFRRTLAASRLHDAKERASERDADTARLRVLALGSDLRPGRPWAIRTPPPALGRARSPGRPTAAASR